MKSDTYPLFIRGFSRSGGTLLVTVFDAHPDIAMNYELYEGLLAKANANQHPELGVDCLEGHDVEKIKNILQAAINPDEPQAQQDKKVLIALREADFPSVGVFMARMARGGLLSNDFLYLVQGWLDKGQSWASTDDRLRFIGFCSELKSKKDQKSFWGLKCNNNFKAYMDIWPKAKFINSIRDPRDVYASQLKNGSFNPNPEKLSLDWVELHNDFEKYKKCFPENFYSYKYEDLVSEPEAVLKKIFEFMEVPFTADVLKFNEQDLTIFDYPRGHLSIERISKPIDITSVGRFADELSDEEISVIEEKCEILLSDFNYI